MCQFTVLVAALLVYYWQLFRV